MVVQVRKQKTKLFKGREKKQQTQQLSQMYSIECCNLFVGHISADHTTLLRFARARAYTEGVAGILRGLLTFPAGAVELVVGNSTFPAVVKLVGGKSTLPAAVDLTLTAMIDFLT